MVIVGVYYAVGEHVSGIVHEEQTHVGETTP
jgi:hypothetical protein